MTASAESVALPAAAERLGPRPLALHLITAMTTSLGALAALPGARRGSLPWARELIGRAAALTVELQDVDEAALAQAVASEAARRLEAMLAGVQRYQGHAFVRDLADRPVIWQAGTTKLRDYGGRGRPLLFIPSLVNRYHVLDLTRERSLLRWLAENGFHPYLVDWDGPGDEELAFDLTGYIVERLEPLLDHLLQRVDQAPIVAGYCMGGNLALALAQRRQAALAGLALLATPWDFHADAAAQAPVFAGLEPALEALLSAFGALPVDVLQALFAALDPNLAMRKFRRFAPDAAAGPSEDEIFVALEDWLNDGIPMAPKVARECLIGWFAHNTTASGNWQIDGAAVTPGAVDLPSLAVIPRLDRIVPPASAAALADALAGAERLELEAGHIGMVVGRGGEELLWQPLARWFASL